MSVLCRLVNILGGKELGRAKSSFKIHSTFGKRCSCLYIPSITTIEVLV